MNKDEQLAYYIGMADFIESPTGQILLTSINSSIELQKNNLSNKMQKINKPEDYDQFKSEFFNMQISIASLESLKNQWFELSSIKTYIKKLQKELVA